MFDSMTNQQSRISDGFLVSGSHPGSESELLDLVKVIQLGLSFSLCSGRLRGPTLPGCHVVVR